VVTELERIYAEIEGEDCQSAVSVHVDPIHVVLDIEQDLELLRDILKMYREIFLDQQYERWQEQFERIFEVLRDLNLNSAVKEDENGADTRKHKGF
jgi:hypothetical protein